ncbi:MAG: hypothetical protein IPP29_20465 [Bacteroidetes bacterium]|nr:hypothetical protein [Bacteroidota bacterium]
MNTPMNNRFFVYLVDSNGIQLQSTQDFNDATDGDFQKIIIHPNGNKFMLINILGYMAEFNFDRCKGIISLVNLFIPKYLHLGVVDIFGRAHTLKVAMFFMQVLPVLIVNFRKGICCNIIC